jgi:DNA-binding MarR family transcriptional regulator
MRNISQKGSLAPELQRFGELIRTIGRQGSLRDPIIGECGAGTEYSHSQIHVIMWLGTDGPLTMGELAKRAGITEKTITGVVDRLERDDLLARTRDQADRRVVRVALTKKGVSEFQRFQTHMQGRMADFLGLLDEADRTALLRILENLCRRLQGAREQLQATQPVKENSP